MGCDSVCAKAPVAEDPSSNPLKKATHVREIIMTPAG